MIEPALALEGVSFAYRERPVLEGLSLELEPGRFHGLVGPNGAGKTTLLDLLAGLRRPAAGRVALGGRDLRAFRRAELARRLALVPQEYAVNFPFSVREVVMMGRHPHLPRFGRPRRTDLAAVERALVALDLADLASTPVTEISGGEKQRVVLARALAQEAGILLLDEPTANLDIRHALQVLALVRAQVRAGRTAVAVMHDLNLAAGHCDRLILLDSGRLVAAGPVAEALTPERIKAVFGVAAKVAQDDFAGRLTVAFRPEG